MAMDLSVLQEFDPVKEGKLEGPIWWTTGWDQVAKQSTVLGSFTSPLCLHIYISRPTSLLSCPCHPGPLQEFKVGKAPGLHPVEMAARIAKFQVAMEPTSTAPSGPPMHTGEVS